VLGTGAGEPTTLGAVLGTGAGELELHPANATIDPSATRRSHCCDISRPFERRISDATPASNQRFLRDAVADPRVKMSVVEDLLQARSRMPRLLLTLMRVCRRLNAVMLWGMCHFPATDD
jgi:hypothetical protein